MRSDENKKMGFGKLIFANELLVVPKDHEI